MNKMFKFVMCKHESFSLNETFNMDKARELLLSKNIDDEDKNKLKKYIKYTDKNNNISLYVFTN